VITKRLARERIFSDNSVSEVVEKAKEFNVLELKEHWYGNQVKI